MACISCDWNRLKDAALQKEICVGYSALSGLQEWSCAVHEPR